MIGSLLTPLRALYSCPRSRRKGNGGTVPRTTRTTPMPTAKGLAHWCHLRCARYTASWILCYRVESTLSRTDSQAALSIYLCFIALDLVLLVRTSQARHTYIYKTIWHRGLSIFTKLTARQSINQSYGTPVMPINRAAEPMTTMTAARIMSSILFCLPTCSTPTSLQCMPACQVRRHHRQARDILAWLK